MAATIADLADLLLKNDMKLSLAESCTGGLISNMIVSVPGSSAYFSGSAVTYSNESKESILSVKHDTLIRYGAVSRETAVEMALGSIKIYDSDVAGSVTGIAGPDGGTDNKPVGAVWMTVTDGLRTISFENHFKGNRDEIRRQAAETLIDNICDFIRGVL